MRNDARTPATCLVTERDFRTHWQGEAADHIPEVPTWSGEERRVSGVADRRQPQPDRRSPWQRGQRYRLSDRRKVNR